MVILLTFLLQGAAPQDIAIVRSPSECQEMARVLNEAVAKEPGPPGQFFCHVTRKAQT